MTDYKSLANAQRTKTKFILNIEKLNRRIQPHQYDNLSSNSGIYIFTYIPNPKYVYIGQASNFQERYLQHCRELENNTHCGAFNTFFQNNHCSIADFKFEILQSLPNDKAIKDAAEQDFIKQYDNDGKHILLNSVKYKGV